MCVNAQELNQLAFKAFLNSQNNHPTENLLEQFIKACMACVTDNTNISIQCFQALSNVKNMEDLIKLQGNILIEYSEKNKEHFTKLLSMYNDLLQENYNNNKQHAEDLAEKFTNHSQEFVKKCTAIDPNMFVNNYNNQYSMKQPTNRKSPNEKPKDPK